MNVFTTDYTDLAAVKRLAAGIHCRGLTMYVVKHTDRPNFNVTMQKGRTTGDGVALVCWYDGRWHYPEELPVVYHSPLPDGGAETWGDVEDREGDIRRVVKPLTAPEWATLRSLEGAGFRLQHALRA